MPRDHLRSRLALTPLEDRSLPTALTVAALVGSVREDDGSTPAGS